MTAQSPPGAGPGRRALLSATAFGAVLVTGLAFAFAALAAGPPARPQTSAGQPAIAAARPSSDAAAERVIAAARAALAAYAAAHGGSDRGATAARLRRYEPTIAIHPARGAAWLSAVEAQGARGGYFLEVTAANGDSFTSSLRSTAAGEVETATGGGSFELRPRRRSR
jgi:hypothetical protein